MTADRPNGSGTYQAIKAATRRLIRACGGLEDAADETRVSAQTLCLYQSPNRSEYVPADVVADLEQVCGDPVVTRALAKAAGYDLVPTKPADPGAGSDLTMRELSRLLFMRAGEFGALADAIDPSEPLTSAQRRALIESADRGLALLHQILDTLRSGAAAAKVA